MNIAARLSSLYEKARQQSLVILVWGPGSANAQYWGKRQQIRQQISALYPNSQVEFSESDALRDHTRKLRDPLVEELAHAAIADCILVIDVSRGASVEVDRFSGVPEIAAKMTVLIPEQFVGGSGLVSHIHKRLNVVGFSAQQLTDCVVASELAINAVDSIAIERLVGPAMVKYL